MLNFNGKCCCGDVEVKLYLPKSLDNYIHRKCDCDFCASRGISYLSNPGGHLKIKCKEQLEMQKHGSLQASFLTCSNCKSVIAASIKVNDKLIGSLNSALLSDFSILQSPTVVSPRLLSSKEKTARWRKSWFDIELIVIT